MVGAEDILDFWFVAHGPDDWFAGRPEFDALIASRFTQTHARAARGEAWRWRATPRGRLAEIIVLDQFSRQLHRGDGRAFASDGMALVLAQEMVGRGLDLELAPAERGFVYLPYMHAESRVIQDEAVRLYEALGHADELGYAIAHRECIVRFGRFPFRNRALGRETTAEESAYIAENRARGF